VDHFVLNEVEITLPLFLDDLRRDSPEYCYTTNQWADLRTTPLPMWDLIDTRQYATMIPQYSRGCPYDCEFCHITVLYGHAPQHEDWPTSHCRIRGSLTDWVVRARVLRG
jgi:radical SAM superfamily enzyme YgiQ (UPF0313 family)